MRGKKRRARHGLPPAEVNIVSLMDILTTLLFFILLVCSFSKFSILNGMPLVSGQSSSDEPDKKVFALEVRIPHRGKAEIFLGPITGLKISEERNLKKFLRRYFSGSPDKGYIKTVWGKDDNQLMSRVQKFLVGIKKGFPHEHKVILAIGDGVKYQSMIYGMGNVRSIASEEQPIEVVNLINQKEKTRVLFPQVVISELKK